MAQHPGRIHRIRWCAVAYRALLAVVAGCAITFWTVATARAAEGEPRPQLVVEEADQDAGVQEPGPKAEFVWRLKNAGTMPLEIREAETSCGCVVASYDKVIKPGAEGTLKATLNTQNRHGVLVKNIILHTNDPQTPAVPLTLKVTLWNSIEVMPGTEVSFSLQPGKGGEREVILHSIEPAALEILKLESSVPYVKATLAPETEVADTDHMGSLWRRKITLAVTPDRPSEVFDVTVAITTNSSKHPRTVLNVTGVPEGAVTAYPPRLYLGEIAASPEQPVSRSVILVSYHEPFKLVSAESSDAAVELQTVPDESGRFCSVVVRYHGGWKPGRVQGKLVFQVTDPRRPRVEVPFEAEVRP